MQKKRRHIGNDSVHIVFLGPKPHAMEHGGEGKGEAAHAREKEKDGGFESKRDDDGVGVGVDIESLRPDDPGSILASSITMVRITIEPLHVLGRAEGRHGRRQRRCFYRISVKARPGLPSFGPLSAGLVQVLPEQCAVEAIRQTAINADRACAYREQVPTCWQERLSQLHRVHNRMQLAAASERYEDTPVAKPAATSASAVRGESKRWEVADGKGELKGSGKGCRGKGKGGTWA
jgi:hypothetical protein